MLCTIFEHEKYFTMLCFRYSLLFEILHLGRLVWFIRVAEHLKGKTSVRKKELPL